MGFGKTIEQPTTIKSELERFVRDSLPDVGPSGRRPCVFSDFRTMVSEPETLPGLDYRRLDSALSKMEAKIEELTNDRSSKLEREDEIKFRLNQAGVPVNEKDDLNAEQKAITGELDDLRIELSQLQDRYHSRLLAAFGSSTSKPEKDTFLKLIEDLVKQLRKDWNVNEVGEILEIKADFRNDNPSQSYVVSIIRRNKTKKFAGRTRALSSWRSMAKEDEEYFSQEDSGPVGGSLVSTVKD